MTIFGNRAKLLRPHCLVSGLSQLAVDQRDWKEGLWGLDAG